MGRTFQMPMPDPDHSAAIVHRAVKILGTGYNALEGNGKILLLGVLWSREERLTIQKQVKKL